MFEGSDPRHDLWDMEEEGGDGGGGDSGSSSDPCWDESAEFGCSAETQDCGRWCQDPSGHLPPQWCLQESQSGQRQQLSTCYGSQCSCHDQSYSGPTNCNGTKITPWRGETPPWGLLPSHWVYDIKAVRMRKCPAEQAPSGASRTLSHPSFQWFYSAVSHGTRSCPTSPGGHAPPLEPEPKAGPPALMDCSSFFFLDPAMPPGHRIYNCLSSTSQKVLRGLRLSPPAPIMSTREAPNRQGLSETERQAVSALLELRAGPIRSSGGWQDPLSLGEDVATLEGKEALDLLPEG